jgi:hypothetical protein
MTTPGLPLRAALYLRVSAARQAEHDVSIPDQRRQGEAYCLSRGYGLVDTFIEAGASATNDRRPEFQRMIEAGTSKPAPFALNSDPCLLRVFAMSHLRPSGPSKARLSLSHLSSFPGPPHDVVVVHSFSRFFRDHFELEFYVRKLAKNGVKLVSIIQEMGDDPMHAVRIATGSAIELPCWPSPLHQLARSRLSDFSCDGKWN